MNDDLHDGQRAPAEANRDYFLTLAHGRFSLQKLSGMAFVTALLLGVDVIPLASMVLSHGERMFEPWFRTHLVLIGLSLLLCLLGAAKSWVFRFQVLSTALMACLAAVGWVYAVNLMPLSMASMVGSASGGKISIQRFAILGTAGVVFALVAMVVNMLLLRRRLRQGHSEERTLGNLGVPMSAARLKMGLLVVGAVFIAANLATGGVHFLFITGSMGFVLLAGITTSLVVEMLYLTHLKSRNRDFWEEAPAPRTVARRDLGPLLKKVVMWTLIAVGAFAVLVVLGMLG